MVVEVENLALQHLERIQEIDLIGGTAQEIPALGTADGRDQSGGPQDQHDLSKVFFRNGFPFHDLSHLQGTAIVIHRQLAKHPQSVLGPR
ncbi:MAG: hypothetical protein A2Z99_14020 [Treponema sp. GWB1_62_6]|nr:MAG: hypothetical protein A2Z99_14020 [Treponema sp. GWB1_62_6]